jgi:hypothetical protein
MKFLREIDHIIVLNSNLEDYILQMLTIVNKKLELPELQQRYICPLTKHFRFTEEFNGALYRYYLTASCKKTSHSVTFLKNIIL